LEVIVSYKQLMFRNLLALNSLEVNFECIRLLWLYSHQRKLLLYSLMKNMNLPVEFEHLMDLEYLDLENLSQEELENA